MKNPVKQWFSVRSSWRSLNQKHPGVFDWCDASMQLRRVLLPARFHDKAAGAKLAAHTKIEKVEGDLFRVDCLAEGITFFWNEAPDNNLWFLIEQEFNAGNPHCYTTPPIQLRPTSLVLDIGACEGLFAFRLIKNDQARRVLCFEPGEVTSALIHRGIEANSLDASRVVVEQMAAARESGEVVFEDGVSATAGRIVDAKESGGLAVKAVSLDEYCASKEICLNADDLIKIDAEGADYDILLGAQEQIRVGGPQIAVTTYHSAEHCDQMVALLRQLRPDYQLRVKGFSFWTERPNPVLLQASTRPAPMN